MHVIVLIHTAHKPLKVFGPFDGHHALEAYRANVQQWENEGYTAYVRSVVSIALETPTKI